MTLNFVKSMSALVAAALLLGACATAQPEPVSMSSITMAAQRAAQAAEERARLQTQTLKRKVAIGRFSNETRYGRSLLAEPTVNPLGRQASDILANRLTETGSFMVFERPDLEAVKAEQAISGESNLVGVDTIILGSVTEFGRSNEAKQGFLSSARRQVARAAVEVRLVDAKTGYVFFTASGRGQASVEDERVAGFGNRVGYDATLNDKAISAAIADLQAPLMNKLNERPWRTDILSTRGNQVFVSGGTRQGLKVGDELVIMKRGEKVRSQQTGFDIELPGEQVARLKVVSFFGSDETNEGAVAQIVTGTAPAGNLADYFVKSDK